MDRYLALLAAFFRLTFVALYSVAKLFEIAAVVALTSFKAFAPNQLHALAYMSLRVHDLGYGASLLFFGCCSIVFGYLIYNSGYLPRTIGILLSVAGVGYAAYSLAQMLAPTFAAKLLFPWLLLPGVKDGAASPRGVS